MAPRVFLATSCTSLCPSPSAPNSWCPHGISNIHPEALKAAPPASLRAASPAVSQPVSEPHPPKYLRSSPGFASYLAPHGRCAPRKIEPPHNSPVSQNGGRDHPIKTVPQRPAAESQRHSSSSAALAPTSARLFLTRLRHDSTVIMKVCIVIQQVLWSRRSPA